MPTWQSPLSPSTTGEIGDLYLFNLEWESNEIDLRSEFANRVYPYVCRAVYTFVRDKADFNHDKELYVSFVDVSSKYKVWLVIEIQRNLCCSNIFSSFIFFLTFLLNAGSLG